MRVDHFGFIVDPIDSPEAFQRMWDDPARRWYAARRRGALVAAGVVGASSFNPNVHPRGKDGKFIERFGWVRWFDAKTLEWRTGWVSDIDAGDGHLTIRSSGEKVEFPNAKNLYSRPKPKALLELPDPTTGDLPDKFVKVGGQGGSNPGGLYQIDGSFANQPPDISKNSKMFQSIGAVRQPGSHNTFGSGLDGSATPNEFIPAAADTVMIPRIDGTLDRYDVVQRFGNQWYRVPASGQVTVDDLMRPELEVSADDAFGMPGSLRRHRVMADLGTTAFTRGTAFDVNDISEMVQQTGSPLPKVGDKYYVKKMNVPERARSEALANDFYELLGVPVPEVAVGKDGSTISSKLVGDTVAFNPNDPQHVAAAQDGFIGDAWLANWDVIGQTFDNIQVDSQGRAWRIDAGGSLEWRAQGKPKGANFGDTVGELDSLRNTNLNPTAGKVFGGISSDRLTEQATVLQSISPAEIQTLADKHDMSHVGPVLIARRKNILDQLHIVDPPPKIDTPQPGPATTVFNPVEHAHQMGTPPTVAVDNWNVGMDALASQKVMADDWNDPAVLDAVWKRDGDLWTYQSGLEQSLGGGHRATFRNVFTGDVKQFTMYDTEGEYLTGWDKGSSDQLVDQLNPARDLAVAEIVARTTHTPLGDLAYANVNKPGDPDGMSYDPVGLGNWATFLQALDRGRFGADHDRPLMHSDGTLWEITKTPGDYNGSATLTRRTPGGDDPAAATKTVTAADFNSSGPWLMPRNDTTGAVWQSKYHTPVAETDPDGQSLETQSAIAVHEQGADDVLALLGPDGGINIAGDDDGVSDAIGNADDVPSGEPPTADSLTDAAPTSSQKVVHGVVAGLSPGTPLLSTEMAVSDVDAIKLELVGKHVIVLPIEAHDNPDWEATGLGSANGLGTVTDVLTKQVYVPGHYGGPAGQTYTPGSYQDAVHVKVDKPYGGFSWVIAGEGSKWKKVVVPVEQAPMAQQVVFKQNGDIFVNGTKVGTHTGYAGIIDGDHSLTGKPMQFSASKKTVLKNAASSLVVPITPKPTKPKSTKVTATEQEIKDLNLKLAFTEGSIENIQEQLENLANATPAAPAGEGNPLNDGSTPAKGDWVFSVKDGTYAQVLNPNVVGFAGKGVLSPDMIKVKIQDPATGKWKQSNRKREQLVSVAAPGDTPFVLQTKALKDSNGNWIGPGTTVYVGTTGTNATVLDTTTDGNVKIAFPDGSNQWVTGQHLSASAAGSTAAMLKTPAGTLDQGKVDSLNAELAALNDEHAQLAATIANTVLAKPPKKKKPVGTPYPGPDGNTYKQSAWLAENREAKGLKNMKDGYVPTPGMIVRHQDGTQYVVYEMGDDWSSHKNSVRVVPIGGSGYWDAKWRAMSTMVVDHEAMLTDTDGHPLPIVSQVEGADWSPQSGMIFAKEYATGYYSNDPKTGKSLYRKKNMIRYYVVADDGTVYNADGTMAYATVIGPGTDAYRIGYLDKAHPGGKTLTVSVQQHHNAQVGQIEYAVIHDPGEAAGIPLAKAATPVPTPTPAAPTPTVPTPAVPTPTPTVPTPAPAAPTPAAPTSNGIETPTGILPAFTGTNPAGTEIPHPPTTTSSDAVPTFKPQGGTPTLDVVGLTGAHSVTAAVGNTLDVAAQNKKDGTKKWVGTYGLGDHDVIEDMMVRTQSVRDAQGVDYVEVSFRLDIPAARTAHTTFMTSSVNEAGDWEMNNRNPTNLVPGDLMAVRMASGGGVAPKDALRPDENATVPNATVVAAPVLIGRNAADTYDVYRTQVITASGDIGFLDLEDRNKADTVQIASWDPTKPRLTTGAKSLNPNAAADGWTVKTNKMSWTKSAQWQQSDIQADGVKTVGTKTSVMTPGPGGGTTESMALGEGAVLQRDYDGVHIEYSTAAKKNTLDGHTVIRVRADDPDAQRKISEAMELVGVSKEKQQPPDKAALINLATTKVYEQFSSTYTRGMKPNGPDDALKAIDLAVGPQLGRPATMDDISVRVTPDGRVQVLVSEDVSRAVVKKNGVKQYVHSFMGKDKLEMVESIMASESPSLLSTSERFQHGLWYTGMSSGKDHTHDSADHLFLSMDKTGTKASSGSAVIDAVALHRHVDYYFQPGDRYGERESNQLNWLNNPSSGELMLQRRMEADATSYIKLSSSERDEVIARLHKRGIFNAPNGKPLEQFLVTTASPFTPPDFGDEITLTAIPDDASNLTLAGV